MQIHRTASFIFPSPPLIEAHVWYDLASSTCTIWSQGLFLSFLYDINLGATTTTILSIRGVTIPIDLVSSAMDSIRWHVVLFKPVPILTSDPKSEFLCQSSFSCAEPADSPWTPRTPGISPMPSSPRIIHTVTVLVLWPSTWSRSSVTNKRNVLVAALFLKSSRVFILNVTSVLIMPWVFLDSALVLRLSFCWMVDGGAVMLCGHCDLQVEILMLWV